MVKTVIIGVTCIGCKLDRLEQKYLKEQRKQHDLELERQEQDREDEEKSSFLKNNKYHSIEAVVRSKRALRELKMLANTTTVKI
jgi:hypothetical protein